MDSLKSPLARMGLAVAVTAILVVVVRDRLEASDLAGWDRLAEARSGGFTVEKLEKAWIEADGTSAEPWAAYQLAMLLYDEGTDMDRAKQVADAALRAFPDHPIAPMLDSLLQALDSYEKGA